MLDWPEDTAGIVVNGTMYPVTDVYRGKIISMLDPHTPVVIDPIKYTVFFVGLDDSKRTGRRISKPATIDDAREYIRVTNIRSYSVNKRTQILRGMNVGDFIEVPYDPRQRQSYKSTSVRIARETGYTFTLSGNKLFRTK